MTIQEITDKYKSRIDFLDLELIIADSLGKTREFVLTNPECKIISHQSSVIRKKIQRRIGGEPIAYITGHKEFYGLDFMVNKHTLIPRPETELMVEDVITLLRSMLRNKISIIDIGTGSGCIITSIASNICHPELVSGSKDSKNSQLSEMLKQVQHDNVKYFGTDISADALTMAKKNAKLHNLNGEIKFLQGDLLSPLMNKKYCSLLTDHCSLIITANLPYLSKEIYNSAPVDVKKFEPKSALYSPEQGLAHYRKLLEQLTSIHDTSYKIHTTCILEISPEQKQPLNKLIKNIFPKASIEFKKDLAQKWRVCKVNL